jgi:hypothetical protein
MRYCPDAGMCSIPFAWQVPKSEFGFISGVQFQEVDDMPVFMRMLDFSYSSQPVANGVTAGSKQASTQQRRQRARAQMPPARDCLSCLRTAGLFFRVSQ